MTATSSPASVPSPAESGTQPGPGTQETPTTQIPSAVHPVPETPAAAAPSVSGPGPAPAARVVDGVWSASRMAEPVAPRRLQPWSLTWGVLLAAVGGVTVAIGLGLRVNLATTGIGLLTTLGVLLLLLALLPQRGRSRSPRA